MSILLIFMAGMLFLAGILFIYSRIGREPRRKNLLCWGLYLIWYGITWTGISFVYINASVGHIKATSTAIFLFGGISVVLAIVLARLLGLISTNRKGSISVSA
ncbi:dehalogenase [Desulfitobacterium chlororespirans]|uniref:Uncharacterized protein n=2 Tax=Desulfitobacterium chlororespirans TaxID=51616 RepID=A0A1M7RVK0_9FIRM|nr:dehalogenase [Desulfitobacterium chlororespirans]AAL84924.1 putative membrane docking protein [Desulfitobacterium chlororespirans]SHN50230.1 hypothetical protein SAMN02745215_00153 [Desulfitobacterium chlororespirans DSM 11544]